MLLPFLQTCHLSPILQTRPKASSWISSGADNGPAPELPFATALNWWSRLRKGARIISQRVSHCGDIGLVSYVYLLRAVRLLSRLTGRRVKFWLERDECSDSCLERRSRPA